MDWLVNNYSLIVIIVFVIIYFLLNGKQSILNWLLYAVTLAERDFSDSGMGMLKLRSVYDSFVVTYPILSKIVPFSVFSSWVDSVLVEMNDMLSKNDNIRNYVNEHSDSKNE